jgi:hypothetical protein
MKKALFGFFLVAIILTALSAEEPTRKEFILHMGLGLEGNMNTDQGYALGRSVSFDCAYFKYVDIGVSLTISDDFSRYTVMEPELFGRWYFYHLGLKEGGLFVQGNLGVSISMLYSNATPGFLGGLRAGLRFPLHMGEYYFEPYIRAGYPFVWGGGVMMGCRF